MTVQCLDETLLELDKTLGVPGQALQEMLSTVSKEFIVEVLNESSNKIIP